MRDSYGNVIYSTVKNGKAQITYKIPAKTKTNSYTITAVFSSKYYTRLEGNTTTYIIRDTN